MPNKGFLSPHPKPLNSSPKPVLHLSVSISQVGPCVGLCVLGGSFFFGEFRDVGFMCLPTSVSKLNMDSTLVPNEPKMYSHPKPLLI